MSLRTDHLRYFVKVAEEGQITRAARKLYIAQPALSQAISQLESELGLQLLERHPRGVRLTSTGEAFLEKARAVVDSEQDVLLTAQSLARVARGVLELGFVGPPPPITMPKLFEDFRARRPQAQLSLRDLPFPRGPTQTWLDGVDVACCHAPEPGEGIRIHPVHSEPRALVVRRSHPLADRGEARVEQVLEETFISYHPDVQPRWAGFHNLDDHRGGPPASSTSDAVATGLEMLATLATSSAVTTLPARDAQLICSALRDLVALPLVDAAPASISFVWHERGAHPLVAALAAAADGREP